MTTTFSADWLALREPADTAARSERLVGLVTAAVAGSLELSVVDLGCGSGSNLRFLGPRMPSPQRWRMLDQDPVLLALAPALLRRWAIASGCSASPEGSLLVVGGKGTRYRIETDRVDLASCDAAVLTDGALVTAAALLDLVSEPWLCRLAAGCRDRRAAVLFALTYDGRVRCSPAEPEDAIVEALVNRHQRTNKGFGAALGPEATDVAQRCFERLGYRVEREPSDWMLGPDSGELQRQLIDGWADAATAMEPARSARVEHWRARRLAHVLANRSQMIVGHQDLAAWLP